MRLLFGSRKPSRALILHQNLFVQLENNLSLGYCSRMKKVSDAAKELARLSVAARRQKWGKKGFRERMRAWGKLGGRPLKSAKGANQ
jgi:hypothetical protein